MNEQREEVDLSEKVRYAESVYEVAGLLGVKCWNAGECFIAIVAKMGGCNDWAAYVGALPNRCLLNIVDAPAEEYKAEMMAGCTGARSGRGILGVCDRGTSRALHGAPRRQDAGGGSGGLVRAAGKAVSAMIDLDPEAVLKTAGRHHRRMGEQAMEKTCCICGRGAPDRIKTVCHLDLCISCRRDLRVALEQADGA